MLKLNTLQEKNYIDIPGFIFTFMLKHKKYTVFSQHDTQEFLRVLLEDICKEFNLNISNKDYNEIMYSDINSKIICDEEFHHIYLKVENSFIVDLFFSQLMTIHTFSYKKIKYSFQKILDFTLLFADNNDNINLEGLLKLYFNTEYVKFENVSPNCKRKIIHKKEIYITKLPETLIISLQRIDILKGIKKESFLYI